MSSQTSTKAHSNMDALLANIRACRKIEEFVAVYDSEHFQHSLSQLVAWLAQKPDLTSVETWAKQWALAVSHGDPAALALNRDRKVCLQLLYSVCDCWRPNDGRDATVSEQDIADVLRDRRVSNILGHCLAMDRAQSLYVMRVPGAERPGMHWYAERHMEDGAWRGCVEGYGGRHTMNKRLLWLVEDLDYKLGLNRGALNKWIQPELVPAV